ncbi:hypothetical protein CYLTODRAFT_491662 [Cylindrobasidium torrendii FP15055 ss-10]|uniref:RING-type E3 ubiquitin transferase n=1 Tax=Cylindrobasidium torrendii FP15055 ss-10 TaxID=1314674 RepID=A0A0D7B9L4_9AGAR|nr:hypothetical protein CYLTODRAFT_491662 [Cylindrobasidium torrendii FP15055 ss-10]
MPINPLLRRGTRALTSSLTTHRLFVYFALSTLAVAVAVLNSMRSFSNFYSITIYLSRSSRAVLVFANFSLILSAGVAHLLQQVFFGQLRTSEVERMYDRMWIFVTESLLAFTIFRDEFDIEFGIMFGILLFLKSFHWISGDRIEWMDQQPYPGPPLLFHIRMTSLFVLLSFADLFMLFLSLEDTLENGVGATVMFACEYAILLYTVFNTMSKYLLSCYDFRRASTRGGDTAPPWEAKSIWTFYVDLITDFCKLTTYLCFFTLILTFYGLPLNIVRDIYFTARSFVTRLKALTRYQTATRNMDTRYPNPTADELASSDRTCIICREEMALPQEGVPRPAGPNTTPKKLPCGHIFHFYCLRSWLERQQSCPTCRRSVLEVAPTPAANGNAAANGQQQQAAARPPGGVLPPAERPGAPPPPEAPRNEAHAVELLRRLVGTTPAAGIRHRTTAQQPINVNIQYDVHHHGPQYQERRTGTPRLEGFVGPDGEWRDWEVPEETLGTDPPEEENENSDPREAARRAALKRFGGLGESEKGKEKERESTHLPEFIPLGGGPSVMQRPLSALPRTATPEQLARIDTLTREAIDERIRVLENVDSAVWRCVDELMKVRSVLPSRASSEAPPSRPSSEAPVAEERASTPVAGTSGSSEENAA